MVLMLFGTVALVGEDACVLHGGPGVVHLEFLEKAVPGEEECPHKMR